MDPLFEIEIGAPAAPREVASSLYRQLKAAILDGRLRPGSRLPPTRKASSFLGVSRNTAADVYERLLHEGLVRARHGSGTFVADPLPDPGNAAPDPASPEPDPRLNSFWTSADVTDAIGFWRDSRQPTLPAGGAAIDLRPALVDWQSFPFATFRQVMARQLRRMETRPARLKSPQGNQGNYHLRHAIAEHAGLTRAVACRADDVLVTSGAQQAFDLIARILVRPGETVVAVEDPGYPPMRLAFAAAGARIVPVPVDEEGLDVDRLPPEVGVICVCPSHQFPLGLSMSPARRKALVDFARARGAVIVEDDYDGEFRYEGSPLEALRTAGSADVVFYVGTFSKCMLPALRLGFVVAPGWALPTLTAAKNSMDWHCSTPLQLGVAAFIADGHLARHVRRMRRLYGERRALLLQALSGPLGKWLAPIPSYYGMHLAATGCPDVDWEHVSEALGAAGVELHGLARYHLGAPERAGLIFGYGAADPPQLRRGVAVLADLLSR